MKKPPSPLLGKTLAECTVPKGSVALAWLGQAGFVLKSPKGYLLAIDPYLSNSCEAIGRSIGVEMKRQFPAPLKPRNLCALDGILFSHSHQDHLDPDTILPYRKAGGTGPYVAPHEAADKLMAWGVPAEQIVVTWPNHTHQIGDFTLKATFAIPLGADDLTHVGYLVDVENGPCLYFTGDTDYNDILALGIAPRQPDVLVTVINSAFRNLSPAEAARLAKALNPRWVIPCHHDLFPDNSLSARLLRTNLIGQGMGDSFCPLEHGAVRIFAKRETQRKKSPRPLTRKMQKK